MQILEQHFDPSASLSLNNEETNLNELTNLEHNASTSSSEVLILAPAPLPIEKRKFFNAFYILELNLRDILEKDPVGATTLRFYTKNGFLNNSCRNIIADVVMKTLYDFIIEK